MPSDAHIVKGDKFFKSQSPQNDLKREAVKQIPYSFANRSLMYPKVCTSLDIVYPVSDIGRFQFNLWMDTGELLRKS